MVSDFSVDIWFIFGSFVYGIEGQVMRYSDESLDVALSICSENERREIAEFFAELAENPKGLVKTEVRIFNDSSQTGASDEERPFLPVSLATQVVPQPTSFPERPEIPGLRLTQLDGLSGGDQTSWLKLVRDIWPRA